MKITLFLPCLVDQFYPEVGRSVIHVLEKLGHTVHYPKDQTCCGQPAFNTGYWKEAADLATRFLQVFEDAELIVAPSGSCTSMVRVFYEKLDLPAPAIENYHHIRARLFEFSEFLVKHEHVNDLEAEFHGTVTYHDSCHLNRELGIEEEPRILLRNVEGLELVEMNNSTECCGFGGTFSVKLAHIASKMVEDKVQNILQTGARYVVANDSGCLMHIQGLLRRNRAPIQTLHLAEVLDNNRELRIAS
jgi:L-lactate dehydrogenase complex protein LldE